MKKITTWKPLSCNCCYRFSWDSESNEIDRVHIFYEAVSICDIHRRDSPKESYIACLEANRTVVVENE